MKHRSSTAALTIAVSIGVAVRPAEAATLAVRSPACEKAVFDDAQLLDVLTFELQSEGLTPRLLPRDLAQADAFDATTLDVDMPCRTDSEYVVLRVRTAHGQQAQRQMELIDLPRRSRPRDVAIVAAELVRAVQASNIEEDDLVDSSSISPPAPEHDRGSEPSVLPAVPPPSTRRTPSLERGERAKRTQRATRLELDLAGEGRLFVQTPTLLYGVVLGGRIGRVRPSVQWLSGPVESFYIHLALASVAVDVWRWHSSRFSFFGGPRLGGGVLLAPERPQQGGGSQAERAPYFDVALDLGSSIRFTRHLSLTFGVDVGYAHSIALRTGGHVVARPGGILTALRVGSTFDP